MGYLANRTINYLNIQSALFGLVDIVWVMFMPIYLYQTGFSLVEVFALLAVFNGARMPLRLLAFPIIRLIGLKRALMLGAAGFSLSFPILGMVQGWDIWLLAYILTFGTFNALYWHCFHTYYTHAGESEHRGKHVSVALSLGAAIAALAPLLSAVVIAHSGFQGYFLLVLPVLAVMLLVLSRCQELPTHRIHWREGLRRDLIFNTGAKIHVADAASAFPLHTGWLFVLFFEVESSIAMFGGMLTFGLVAQMLYQLWLGGALDRGAGRSVAHLAGATRVAEALAMALLPLSPARLLALEGLKGVAGVHHGLAYSTVMYNAGKDSRDPLWYWLFAETAFDIGTIIGAGGAALLLWLGVPLRLIILLSIPGLLVVWWLAHRYFPKRPKKQHGNILTY